MIRKIDIVCPFCKQKQPFEANTDKEMEVIFCSYEERGPGDILAQSGCGKQSLVRTAWAVKATVAKIVWPDDC